MIQRARDEGRQDERRKAAGMIQRARNEGRQEVLERQLQRRFGVLSPGVAERLRQASAGDLEAWADNVLEASTLDEVFRPGA